MHMARGRKRMGGKRGGKGHIDTPFGNQIASHGKRGKKRGGKKRR